MLILTSYYGVPHHVIDFALKLREKDSFKVHGLFIHRMKGSDMEGYPFPSDINLTDTDYTKETQEEEYTDLEISLVKVFRNTVGSDSEISMIRDMHLERILDESVFADLILCDEKFELPHFSLNSLLSSANCPVLLIPEESQFPNEIVLAYDSSSSSIHAMKQFIYLFPSLAKTKTRLVSVVPSTSHVMHYDSLVRSWVDLHFPNNEIVVLYGESRSQLPDHINQLGQSIIVMGAFGRSALSRLFKGSLANTVLLKTKKPVFIANA